MARVLILSLVFPPDNVSTAQLMGEVALDLRAAGHDVRVISTVPHYHPKSGGQPQQPLKRNWQGLVQTSKFDGIPVQHVWMPRKGRNLLVRALAWGGFHIGSTVLAVTGAWRPEVVLAPSPPLTIGASAWLVCLFRRARFIYNIQEIYPDVAVHLGLVKSPAVIWVLQKLERFIYRKATLLTTISPSMRSRVLDKGVPEGKVRVVPNFVDLRTFESAIRENKFARSHALEGKFVICYAGNMGKPQGLEVFIEAMGHLRDRPTIHLLMVGGGSEYEELKRMTNDAALNNVTFLPQQEYALVPQIYACANLLVVAQAPGTHSDGIPSKVYRIMGSRRAVLAYTSDNSDLAWLVHDARAGLVTQTLSPVQLAEVFRQASDHPAEWDEAGARGCAYVAEHFARPRVTQMYAEIIAEVAAGA